MYQDTDVWSEEESEKSADEFIQIQEKEDSAIQRLEEYGLFDFPPESTEFVRSYYGPETVSNEENESDVSENEEYNEDSSGSESEEEYSSDDGSDFEEDSEVTSFIEAGCGCDKSCHLKFSLKSINQSRIQTQDLNERCNYHVNHKHIFLLGALNAFTRSESTTSSANRKSKSRKRLRSEYHFKGIRVCQEFFQFVNSCGRFQLKQLRKTIKTVGLVPQKHQNVFKTSQVRSLPLSMRIDVRDFIQNYASQHGLVLPGRVPSHKNLKVIMIPCSMKKSYIYKEYVSACNMLQKVPVKKRSWYSIWKDQCSHVVIQKPRTDLCPTCKENETSLGKMTRLSPNQQEDLILKSSQHLQRVKDDRKYYNDLIAESRNNLETCVPKIKIGPHLPQSLNTMVHYSFDFAQQVHLPSSPDQVGPLYFLTGYKVSLFGVAIEPLGKFVLYLIPESCVTGKGANIVISLVHHFFEHFALGEDVAHFHADNCTGQNKNNYLMQYFVWRVVRGFHKKISCSFLPVGHTKFSPDLYFGLFKRSFGVNEVHTLDNLTQVAQTSTSNQSVTAVMVGNEQGESFVKAYNWKDYFKQINPGQIPNILKMYHFEASSENLGSIRTRSNLDEDYSSPIQVLPSSPIILTTLPETIVPAGLSSERKKYLYEKIRPFVQEDSRDILCPLPVSHHQPSPSVDEENILEEINPVEFVASVQPREVSPTAPIPKPKKSTARKNRCGNCGADGHTNRVRPDGSFVCPVRIV